MVLADGRSLAGALRAGQIPGMTPVGNRGTASAAEVAKFDALAATWWDPRGPMAPLHAMNPARMGWILDRLPGGALDILDVGCGAGLASEALARAGHRVTGLDAAPEALAAARAHAEASGPSIDYQVTTAEALADSGAQFDIVTTLEVVEHVADVDLFLTSCASLVKPGGMLVLSTLNRTAKSFVLGIGMAEYVLRWLPAGTHDWRKFLKPSEVAAPLMNMGLEVTDITGLVYDPLRLKFKLSDSDLDVNYLMVAVKDAA